MDAKNRRNGRFFDCSLGIPGVVSVVIGISQDISFLKVIGVFRFERGHK